MSMNDSPVTTAVRQRVRFRFRKEGDLRLISHKDLVRAWERLFRRAGLPLGMSEGFHPKPRMSFPLALAVGVAGLNEVMELELCEEMTAEALISAMTPHLPPGLVLSDIAVLPPGTKKAQARRAVYEVAVPENRRADAEAAIARLLAAETCVMAREAGKAPLDIRPLIDGLSLSNGILEIAALVTPTGSARPREVLAALSLADLEELGYQVTRSTVEVES